MGEDPHRLQKPLLLKENWLSMHPAGASEGLWEMHQSNSDWRPPDPQSEGAEGNRVTGLRAALAALGPQELLQEAGVVHGGVAAAPAVVGAPRGPRPPQAGVGGVCPD